MSELHLRPYQRDAIAAIKSDWQTLDSVLLVAAMGAGKTIVTIKTLTDVLGPGQRGLILAHRMELVTQPLDKIREFLPAWEADTGIVMADLDECDRQLTLATVQTLSRPDRLARLLAHGPIDYVVRDEAHHSTSKTDMDLFAALRRANPRLKLLGVTATPIRADGDGMSKVYQKVSAKYGIKELIQLGHLVPFKALAVQVDVSLKGVATRDGDFAPQALAEVWERSNVWDLVIESHKRFAGDRPSICFTVSVAGAHELAERFRQAGIAAEAADGTFAKEDRVAILNRFRRGETQVLVNVGIWTEGLDVPRIACAHMIRPTKSDALYCQCVGRALRTYPGKDDALILDYAPVDARNIVMAGDLLGKPRAQKKVEGLAEKAGVVISGFSFTGDGTGIDGDPDELVTRPLNYLSMSPYAWYFHDGLSTLGLGDKDGISRTLVILPPGFGRPYRLVMVERPKGEWNCQTRVIARGDFDDLADRGANLAEELGAPVLVGRDKGWQRMPLTDKQLALLHRLIPGSNGNLEALSRGAAAKLLTHCYARQAIERAGWRPDPAAKAS